MLRDCAALTDLWAALGRTAWPALLKIALLIVTGVSVHASLSPPNPPPPPAARLSAARTTLFERGVRRVTFCSKTMVWIGTTLDILATTALAFPALPLAPTLSALLSPHAPPPPSPSPCPLPSPSPSPFAPAHPPPPALLAPSPLLALGALATLLGALLRRACFRALGPLFTFELAIAPAHALVTAGPYAWVRHPSYAGVYLTLLGASAVALAPGAWLRECALRLAVVGAAPDAHAGRGWGVHAAAIPPSRAADVLLAALPAPAPPACAPAPGLSTALAWLACAFWCAKVAYALRSTHRRLRTEDAELRKAFGAAWDAYAESVRWRLLPGVF